MTRVLFKPANINWGGGGEVIYKPEMAINFHARYKQKGNSYIFPQFPVCDALRTPMEALDAAAAHLFQPSGALPTDMAV